MEIMAELRQRMTHDDLNSQITTNRLMNALVHSRILRRFLEKRMGEQEDYVKRSTRIQRRFKIDSRGRKVDEINNMYFECEYCKILKLGSLPGILYTPCEKLA